MSWDWCEASLGRLQNFLAGEGLTDGPLTTTRIGDGHSNLTYLVSDGKHEMVLRRPPPPPLPVGAHDVLREARLIKALEYSGVPVAKVLAVDDASQVLDVPFYIMEYLAGEVITDVTPASLAIPAQRQFMAETLVDTLVALHKVDWRARGLEGFGKPDGFNARHFKRIKSLIPDDEKLSPAFAELSEWLAANIPMESDACIVHNDFRIGNVMWKATAPTQLLAVLDWELATLGDPLFDLAYFINCYPRHGIPRTPTQDLAAAVLEDGYLEPADLIARYVMGSGRDVSNLKWYQVFVDWKLAILYDYSRRRGGDDYYQQAGLVERFLNAALSSIDS